MHGVEKQACSHNPSRKQNGFIRLCEFLFSWQLYRELKEGDVRCAHCGAQIKPPAAYYHPIWNVAYLFFGMIVFYLGILLARDLYVKYQMEWGVAIIGCAAAYIAIAVWDLCVSRMIFARNAWEIAVSDPPAQKEKQNSIFLIRSPLSLLGCMMTVTLLRSITLGAAVGGFAIGFVINSLVEKNRKIFICGAIMLLYCATALVLDCWYYNKVVYIINQCISLAIIVASTTKIKVGTQGRTFSCPRPDSENGPTF